jgi:putative peptidoglycan lipid II flippase
MEKILKSAFILAVISICVRLLGPAKNMLIAHTFGVSRKLDAYFIAQNLIDVIVAVFTFTIVILAVPAFIEETASAIGKGERVKSAFNSFLVQNIVLSFIFACLFLALSRPLAQAIPGFSGDVAQAQLSNLLSLLSLTLLFAIPNAALTGYFYSRSQVVFPSSLMVIPIFAVILSILFLSGLLDIYSIPSGFILGYFFVSVVLFLIYRKRGGGFSIALRDLTIVRKVKGLILPTMIFAAGGHINLIIDQFFASRIKDGGVSILTYAQFFVLMPFTILTLPLLTAAYPEMSRAHTLGGKRSLLDITSNTFIVLATLMLPVVLTVVFFRASLIDLFYNHGNFDSRFVEETASTLVAYAPAIFFLSLSSLLQRVFFTKRAMVSLMMLTLFSIALNIFLDIYLSSRFSIVGIALATSVNEILYFSALIFILNKRHRFNIFSAKKTQILGIFLCTSFIALTFLIVQQILPLSGVASKLQMLLHLALYLAAGAGVFLISMRLLFKVNIFAFIKGKNG